MEVMLIIKRDLMEEIAKWLFEEKVLIINGARQVGKTTLLSSLKTDLEAKGYQVLYFTADREIGTDRFSDPVLFHDFLQEQYNIKDKETFLLIDEFQYIDSPGLFIKVLFDLSRRYLRIILSGSSSLEISKAKEYLTGRKIEFLLKSFSFREFLHYRSEYTYDFDFGFDDSLSNINGFNKKYGSDLKKFFLEYINWGGYPEVVLQTDLEKKIIILQEIISTYIEKDIVNFLRVENISGFNNLVKILSMSFGSLINKSELSNTLSINYRTLNKYLDILSGTYIFTFIHPHSTNPRKTLTRMRKVYANDLGLRRYYERRNFTDYFLIPGNVIENFVFRQILENFKREDILFHRTKSGSEIDFLIQINQDEYILYESKFRNLARIPVAIRNFQKTTGKKIQTIVLTKEKLAKQNEVLFLPVYLFPFFK